MVPAATLDHARVTRSQAPSLSCMDTVACIPKRRQHGGTGTPSGGQCCDAQRRQLGSLQPAIVVAVQTPRTPGRTWQRAPSWVQVSLKGGRAAGRSREQAWLSAAHRQRALVQCHACLSARYGRAPRTATLVTSRRPTALATPWQLRCMLRPVAAGHPRVSPSSPQRVAADKAGGRAGLWSVFISERPSCGAG